MRHTLRLRVLLPALASIAAAAACGGATDDPGKANASSTSSSSGSSGTSGGSSGGSSGSSGTSGSSGSSSGTSGTPPPVFDMNVCTGNEYKILEGVTITGIDYLELRTQADYGDPAPPNVTVEGSVGKMCATASDEPKCTSAVAALRSDGWEIGFGGQIAQHRYAVTTKGDVIGVIKDPALLSAVITPVDNAKDAALLVAANGQSYFLCDHNNARKTATGWEVLVHSGTACGEGTKEVERTYAVTTDGAVTLEHETVIKVGTGGCAIGRRPEGLAAHEPGALDASTNALGRFFAEAAHLEAASVFSFARLADELRMLDAPTELVDAALSSREDEVRHARMTAKMAHRFGASTEKPIVTPPKPRSALAIALENAREGCVRETYGALVAHRQADTATDQSIRCMMQVIAVDETKHAGLAWDVAAWLEPQLSVDEREIVDDARRRAIAELRAELLSGDPHADLRTRAGMPDAGAAAALLDALDGSFLAVA